jgi:tetratricopeptide (TPR) repeat protein
MAKGNLQQAKQWFEMAEQIALGLNDEAYIRSLNRQGRLLVRQEKWLAARPLFERAIDAAKKVHNDYQHAENLIDLAETLAPLGQEEQSNQLFKEAEDISSKWNYLNLLGRAEDARGDICYGSGDYQNAFVHYRQYCWYMARRNEVEYNGALDKVVNQLFEAPKDELSNIVSEFIAYWSAQHMDRDYATLIDTLQEVKKANFVGGSIV